MVKTGIAGLDEILGGGIPERSVVVLQGGPGTGKTIFGLQFLHEGILRDEPGIFITTDEPPARIYSIMQQFGWNPKEGNYLTIIDSFSSNFGRASGEHVIKDIGDANELIDTIVTTIKNSSAKRLVVDNFTSISIGKPVSPRILLLNIKRITNALNCTALIIVNQEEKTIEHVADGLIKLFIDDRADEIKRVMYVVKMRGVAFKLKKHIFEIEENGLKLKINQN